MVVRMGEAPAKYAAKLPSTPENMAACKTKYEVNKVPLHAPGARVQGRGRPRVDQLTSCTRP